MKIMIDRFYLKFGILLGLATWMQVLAATIQGTVSSAADQELLISANVVLINTLLGASTDLDGRFVIKSIDQGSYSLRVSCLGYESKIFENIVIIDGRSKDFKFELNPGTIQLEEVVVSMAREGSEEKEINERFDALEVMDSIGGEQIKALPDPDVSKVVRRATGVSSMDGNPIIRGLGLRYAKVSLNNAQIASTEPNRSSVALDLFPASMMRQVSVRKSYYPDQFGEFGGGLINMSTWEHPPTSELNISYSTSHNSNSTFQNFYNYDGGGLDLLGFDDGTRAMPDIIAESERRITERGLDPAYGYSIQELESMGKAFDNNWSPTKSKALPSQSINASYGAKSGAISYLLSGLYRYKDSYTNQKHWIYKGGTGGEITPQHNYAFNEYKRSVVLGGMATMSYNISALDQLRLNLIYNHDTDDETRFFSGWNDDRGKEIRDTRLRFVSKTTLSSQISGQHLKPEWWQSQFNWQFNFSRGLRYEPDTREVQYEADPGEVFRLADETQSGSRTFNDLADDMYNFNLDYTVRPSKDGKFTIKTGFALIDRVRDSENRFFQFEPADFMELDTSLEMEELFAPENINSEGFMIREATRPTDSYTAEQQLAALYFTSDMEIVDNLRLSGGLRYERSNQKVTSYELFTATQTPVLGEIVTGDFLPVMNLTWQRNERSNIRLALSQTVSRPDFRELSEFEFTDIIGGHTIIGNPQLKRALIRHADLRYEFQYGVFNLFSASAFYKRFINPIETVIQATAQHRVSYENAESAENYGLELELRQSIGELLPVLDGLNINTNITFLNSEIQLADSSKGIQTSPQRPMHGQSSYLVNLNLNYKSSKWGTQLDLFYHNFGKRIVEVGSKPLPDIYELSRPELDLTFSQPLGRKLKIKGGLQNILDPMIRFRQGGHTTKEYRNGRSVSFGISYSL
jgi:outer membrane receptor protein involved in Fe transport